MMPEDGETSSNNHNVHHYELLGAPTLIYRNRHQSAANNDDDDDNKPSSRCRTARPWGLEQQPHYEARYWHDSLQRGNRVRARWYHHVDNVFRQEASARRRQQEAIAEESSRIKRAAKKRKRTNCTDNQGSSAEQLQRRTCIHSTEEEKEDDDNNVAMSDDNDNDPMVVLRAAAQALEQQDDDDTPTSSSMQQAGTATTQKGEFSKHHNRRTTTEQHQDKLVEAASFTDAAADDAATAQGSTGDEEGSDNGKNKEQGSIVMSATQNVGEASSLLQQGREIVTTTTATTTTTTGNNTPKKKKRAAKIVEPLLDPHFLNTRVDPMLHASRQHILDDVNSARGHARQHVHGTQNDVETTVTCRSYQQYDHSYLPSSTTRRRKKGGLKKRQMLTSRSWNIDRMDNGHPANLAPIHHRALHYCLRKMPDDDQESCNDDNDTTLLDKRSKARRKKTKYSGCDGDDSTDSPIMYGNCLVCTACPCFVCSDSTVVVGQDKCMGDADRNNGDDGDNDPIMTNDKRNEHCTTANTIRCTSSWCLLHPTGELRSRVCVSNLLFPFGAKNSAPLVSSKATSSSHNQQRRRRRRRQHELDVGETILQIAPCGNGQISNSKLERNEGMFVVRSANYCTVIRVRTDCDQTEEEVAQKARCPGLYSIEEVARIDLRSLSRWFPSYKPMDVAAHPRYGNTLSSPKFAILSRCASRNMQCNTIHHVSLRAKPATAPFVEEHTVASLKSISCIDFTSAHPMTLWAAAESYVRPKLVSDIYSTKPLLGHGHSLYTIDLRCNEATFQWSPSAEEMIVEGVHSISGIMTDWETTHRVWVSSLSAGKTWEIDGRMPCRAVNTFSLASATDESRTLLPETGLNGAGSIMTQPVVSFCNHEAKRPRPVLSMDKSPGAFGIHVYQRPEFRPRFQTNSLEVVTGIGLSARDNEASFARSSCFPLPDVSERVFTCGLAAFRTSASDFLSPNALDLLGTNSNPTNALCALTMTNEGDLYCHSLLECDNERESQSKTFPGLPLGCAPLAVPVASSSAGNQDEERRCLERPQRKAHGGWNLPLSLSNRFPLGVSELTPMSVKNRKECRPFTTVRLEHLPALPVSKQMPRQEEQEVKEPAVGLPIGWAREARKDVTRFQDCFVNERKSVVESARVDYEELRSDMTSEVFRTASDLWSGEEGIESHTVRTEKPDGLLSNGHASI